MYDKHCMLTLAFDYLGILNVLYTDRFDRHMAADEMRTITSDKWTDDVWGVGCASEPITRLFFYFGRNDHWVAEKTRDEVIALRGREGGLGPKMFVCEEGLPHAFCLSKLCVSFIPVVLTSTNYTNMLFH